MINFGNVTKKPIREQNLNLPKLPNHPYRILITGGSGSRKSNSLFNLTRHQQDIDKIYLYPKDPCEAKYQLLINKKESTSLNYLNTLFKYFI